MRLIKVLGLAGLTAVVAMAFVGASSATATGITAACKTKEAICPESQLVHTIHLSNTEGSTISILNKIANILCLGVLAKTISLQVGIPQKINTESFSFTGCGTSAAHKNCAVEFKGLPSFTLLKEKPNLGVLTATKGKLLVQCEGEGFSNINCTYDTKDLEFNAEGALHQAGTGHGMVTASNAPLSPEVETEECPKEAKLDLLLEPSEHVYIGGIGNQNTALCKVHEEPCKEANLIKSIHTFTEVPLLKVKYSGTSYSIICAQSLAKASVGELGSPQEIAIEELEWTGCKVGAEACTIKSIENGVLSLYKIGLNVGEATSSENIIEASCTNPNFTCVFSSEPKLRIEGAGHTAGAGNGMFESNEPELENVEGNCEGPGFLYGLYEPLTSIYVVS